MVALVGVGGSGGGGGGGGAGLADSRGSSASGGNLGTTLGTTLGSEALGLSINAPAVQFAADLGSPGALSGSGGELERSGSYDEASPLGQVRRWDEASPLGGPASGSSTSSRRRGRAREPRDFGPA